MKDIVVDAVEFVEQNQIYKAPFLANNPQKIPYSSNLIKSDYSAINQKRNFVTQWNVPSWGIARINHRDLQDLTLYTVEEAAGAGIHVYVLDSGIQEDHPDFEGRAHTEANFITYEDSGDHSGHGTHVAGIIGGNIFGVAKKTFVHAIKILDRNGDGTTSALLQAIAHIAQFHEPSRSIINLSLSGPRSKSIDDALSMLVEDHNIPIFVSAGNTGDDACDYSPAANPDVFAVGASDSGDNIPSFSSFGSCVSMYAPGTNITSTWIKDSALTMDGTSMANPHVSGIAAMLMSKRVFQSPHELYGILRAMATPNTLKPQDKAAQQNDSSDDSLINTTIYGSHWASMDIPRYALPESDMPSRVAYQLIKDEIALDGKPALNLATFVTTFMEEEAEKLMAENLSKNFIDFEEYPQTAEISDRCVNIIARLFNAPLDNPYAEAVGCSTVGSSEAIILATLAMKRRWQNSRKEKNLPSDQPNFIMGANCQVAWHKAVRYLDIEGREVKCTEDSLCMDPKKAVELVDENTIGICAILGSTYTGHYEDVETLSNLLDEKCKSNGWDIGIHVDAASGGFIAPFIIPELAWDFRISRVHSINVSGHKYGLTYPGIGWALWRDHKYLPQELVFNINYLGSDQASFTFNFSKGASNVIAQYYVLIRLGRIGFTKIMTNLVKTADYLADKLEETGLFTILSPRHGKGIPLVACSLKDKEKIYDEFDLAAKLRERGWIVPAYTMAPNAEHIKLLRIVVREDFSFNRCELLLRDILAALDALNTWSEKEMKNHRNERKTGARHKNRASFQQRYKKHHKASSRDKRDAPGIC
ncbi:hypothetical protein G6F57_009192 [Rhizopus arrhizus]|uniref:Glutamate decarboxylase n=1 Tax=Rhizopus oryzae TaxID=64495 RepID=A0A9P6X3S5_RHIOR|nr:hypothetical protein G6F24_009068 [Rhizopus arrhizus]KAG1416919.1 hypothetical protein G6F58_005740 [Rhizopus delemar]KAG0785584.1 hypothetical protein G6F21_009159 [Rhizopus arrhizus]KAG0800031.1 hypothetical protein G6F22_002637 [Rhizopus arrhizus]KAG0809870.1 hypothetical protein G6F20_008425 [Rhizopus arrhizus]